MEEQKYMITIRSYGDMITKGDLTSVRSKVKEIPVTTLCENLSEFVKKINQSIGALDDNVSNAYSLDEFEIHAEITLSGSINLIGGLSSGTTGGITLRFKKNS